MAKKKRLGDYTPYFWVMVVLAFLVGAIVGFLIAQGVSSTGLVNKQPEAVALPPGPFGPEAQWCIANQCQPIGCCSGNNYYWCEQANPSWCFG